jgi:ribonuclease HI
VGILIINACSKVVKYSYKVLPMGMNNCVELEALSMGLDLAIILGIKDIIIEGDSMVTFHMVTNKKSYVWSLQYLLDKILLQLNSFTSYIISLCYRDVNGVENYLENKAINEHIYYAEIEGKYLPPFNK